MGVIVTAETPDENAVVSISRLALFVNDKDVYFMVIPLLCKLLVMVQVSFPPEQRRPRWISSSRPLESRLQLLATFLG